VKLSQPLLELKRSLVSNKGAPESLSTNTPSGVFLKISYCLQKRPYKGNIRVRSVFAHNLKGYTIKTPTFATPTVLFIENGNR
jgi:hypothetical protein